MQDALLGLAWVALGAALGGTARYLVSGLVGRRIGETFPWGTMVVNVTGAFALGMLVATAPMSDLALFAITGFLGSFTTVSSFSLQTLALARDGELGRAAANIGLSVALCLAAVALGYAAA